MAAVRRLVIDVLKPHDPPLLVFTDQLAEIESVEGVTSSLIELDQEVQNIGSIESPYSVGIRRSRTV